MAAECRPGTIRQMVWQTLNLQKAGTLLDTSASPLTGDQRTIREQTGQLKWHDLQLPDLRTLARELRCPAIEEVQRADHAEGALQILLTHFGLTDPLLTEASFITPIGTVLVPRTSLPHIVEKRADSRERYVRHAIDTLMGPFEIWRVAYTNGCWRLVYINVYEAKNDMVVIVDVQNGEVLWNFFHAPSRSVNKHRHGELLFKRYEHKFKEKGQP